MDHRRRSELHDLALGILRRTGGDSAAAFDTLISQITGDYAGQILDQAAEIVNEAWRVFRPVELTDREMNVLRLVAQGHGNRFIAQRIGVECCTVKTHIRNIMRKLNADNRTEAVFNSVFMGILDISKL